MAKLRLVTSDRDKAEALCEALRGAGYSVDAGRMSENVRQQLLAKPPQGIILDLARAPATGRDLGLYLRVQTATRHMLIVFLDGQASKVEAIRRLLPDAVFTTSQDLLHDLAAGLADPLPDPIVPASVFAGYAGRPLPAKLGIKTGMLVSLIDAPPDFEASLRPLEAGVELDRGMQANPDMSLWFVRTLSELENRLVSILDYCAEGKLWMIWPKKSSGVPSDLTQQAVRQAGLAAGWVDFKVCAVDATWTGLCFTRRKQR